MFGHTFKIRLCALNDDSSEESEPEPTQESLKQAKVCRLSRVNCFIPGVFPYKVTGCSWSHLGCSGGNAIVFSCKGITYRHVTGLPPRGGTLGQQGGW